MTCRDGEALLFDIVNRKDARSCSSAAPANLAVVIPAEHCRRECASGAKSRDHAPL
jgi:hypothetical protein